MNTKYEVLDGAPNPWFSYQGAYLSNLKASMAIGPYALDVKPPKAVGVGYAVAQQECDRVPVTTVRTASIQTHLEDKPTSLIQIGYDQNNTEWLMAFSVLSDPQGGLVGTDFALEVQSNYPQIPMSVARTPLTQKGLNVLTKGILPADYRAQLTLLFWNNGKTGLPLDAWLSVQVGYIKAPQSQHRTIDLAGIPLVSTGEVLFFPTPGGEDNPVLCNNYPALDRHSKPRIL